MRSLVSLWFPEFPVERFIRTRIKTGRKPPAKGLPFALVESGKSGLRLIAVNATAAVCSCHQMKSKHFAQLRKMKWFAAKNVAASWCVTRSPVCNDKAVHR